MSATPLPVRVLFVCTGNICRSPTAVGVFRALVEAQALDGRIEADSAGIGHWHVGEPPDERAQRAAAARGIDLSHMRARQVAAADFDRFHLIVALDRSHRRRLSALAPDGGRERIRLLMEFAPHLGVSDVPDPYYGGPAGFERVLDLIEAGAAGLLDALRERFPGLR